MIFEIGDRVYVPASERWGIVTNVNDLLTYATILADDAEHYLCRFEDLQLVRRAIKHSPVCPR